jgi:pyruvate-formate lyase-activating enzyme
MNTVTVKRTDLIGRIKRNRDEHHMQFEKAQEGFRARVIEELDAMLAAARRGDQLRTSVKLVPPENHTADYDRALDMLTMSTDEEIEIDTMTFAQLVRNEWAWFSRASHVNTMYATGGKVDA